MQITSLSFSKPPMPAYCRENKIHLSYPDFQVSMLCDPIDHSYLNRYHSPLTPHTLTHELSFLLFLKETNSLPFGGLKKLV